MDIFCAAYKIDLFTCVLLEYLCTYIAFNLAAPVEFAVAALTNDDIFGVVASATAEYTAAIETRR